jgi:hypothetical protein
VVASLEQVVELLPRDAQALPGRFPLISSASLT